MKPAQTEFLAHCRSNVQDDKGGVLISDGSLVYYGLSDDETCILLLDAMTDLFKKLTAEEREKVTMFTMFKLAEAQHNAN